MPRVDSYESGAPCWVQLAAGDPSAAVSFYGGLFGWEDEDASADGWGAATSHGPARICTLEGRLVAGIALARNAEDAGWRTFFAVSDLEDSAKRIADADGRQLTEVETLGSSGRMAMFADSASVRFGAWEAGASPGAGVVREPDTYAMGELITDDVDASRAFYATVFGWSLGEPVDPLGRRDWSLDGQTVGVLLPRPPAMPSEVSPYWDVYFQVDDTDKTAETASNLGAAVLMPPTDTAHGRIAVFADPGGSLFSVSATTHDA